MAANFWCAIIYNIVTQPRIKFAKEIIICKLLLLQGSRLKF